MTTSPFGTPPPPPADAPAAAPVPEASGSRPTALLVALGGVLLLALAGGGAFLLLGGSASDDLAPTSVLAAPAATPAATAEPTAAPTASPTREVVAARNPFVPLVASAAPAVAADPAVATSTSSPSVYPPAGTDPATVTDKGATTTPARSRSTVSSSSPTGSGSTPPAPPSPSPSSATATATAVTVTYTGISTVDPTHGAFSVATKDASGSEAVQQVDRAPGAALGDAAPLSGIVLVEQAADGSSAAVRYGSKTTVLTAGQPVRLV